MSNNKYTPSAVTSKNLVKVKQIRFLTESTFVLRFGRENLKFKAGQYITAGIKDSLQCREYSIYSGEDADYLEVLVKEVLEGNVSVQLRYCKIGQLIEINGPFGLLKISKDDMHSRKFIFIASGTGIAPFHSFVASYKAIDYTILHGVRYISEAYDRKDYDPQRYILCTSREKNGNFHGRVTDFLQDYRVIPDMLFYVCGNGNMIYDVYTILRKKGVKTEDIHSEVYF